jgi:hypothetical protein
MPQSAYRARARFGAAFTDPLRRKSDAHGGLKMRVIDACEAACEEGQNAAYFGAE